MELKVIAHIRNDFPEKFPPLAHLGLFPVRMENGLVAHRASAAAGGK